MEDTEDD